ncbi:MAG: sugar ABC transporter substrate-binding protein [bacterium]
MPTVLCLLMLAGCGSPVSDETQSAAPAKSRVIGVSFQSMNNPFFVDLNEGLQEVIEAHGDKLVTLDAQWNSMKQMNDLSDLILQGAACVFVNPVNWEGIRGSLEKAKQNNVPVIVVDAPVRDQELILSTVASDNVEAGRLAAKAMAEAVRPAKIGILALSINKACIDRVAGFKEVIAQYPDMIIVDEQEVKGTTESSRPVMRDMIGRHPEINALFAINDPTALGAISALESAGQLKGVKICSVDGAPEAVQAIREGQLLATSAQFPYEMGKASAQLFYDHLEGKTVEKDLKIRVELITAANAEQFLKK